MNNSVVPVRWWPCMNYDVFTTAVAGEEKVVSD